MPRILPPIAGAANASAYAEKPDRFGPATLWRNWRPHDAAKDLPRLGVRPGLRKLYTQNLGGRVQALATVSRASGVSGYTPTNCLNVTGGESTLAGELAGQVSFFRPGTTPQIVWMNDLDGTQTISAPCIGRHPDTDLIVAASAQYDPGGGANKRVKVVAYNSAGRQSWIVTLATVGLDRFVNTLAVGRLYTYVCTNKWLVALRNDTGAVAATTDLNGWSSETIECRIVRDGLQTESVYVSFNGSTTGVTLPNAPNHIVTAGFYAKSFRAGVMKFTVPNGSYATTPVFTQAQFGPQIPATDPFWESAHGYFRFSEQSAAKPRGAIVNAMTADSDGSLIVVRCNAGGGPNATWKPDLLAVDPITVCKIGPDGKMKWEVDTDSIVEAGVQSSLNDIPTGTGDEPSLQAAACDGSDHSVYVGGRANDIDKSVFKLRGADGAVLWAANYAEVAEPAATIRQGCMRVDATDGNLVLGGDRNNDWDGADGAQAQVWKANRDTGANMWALDIGEISCLGVTMFNNGDMALATDEVVP